MVEWKLISMPIPRLQIIGREEDRILYDYGWTKDVPKSTVSAYQEGKSSSFDNRLLLKPGTAEAIKSVAGILRPLVRREWAMMVASMNGLTESKLEGFLFGMSRIQLDAVRNPLRDLNSDRCFYCEGKLSSDVEVDHFIPWARYPDNALDNLVPSHAKCNNQKRDFIAAENHLERWVTRTREREADLKEIARYTRWDRDRQRSEAVAKCIYLRLHDGSRLWLAGATLVPVDRHRVERVFHSIV